MPRHRLAPIKGSAPDRSMLRSLVGAADADDRLAVRVVMRPRPLGKREPLARKYQRWMEGEPLRFSEREIVRLQSPDRRELRELLAFGRSVGLEVAGVSRPRHDVVLAGRSEIVADAFGVDFELFDSPVGPRRAHRGEIHLPTHLHESVVGVLGLDDLPRHRPAGVAPGPGRSYSPRTIARHYRFPASDASGQRIAILAFGGGFHRSDLDQYFKRVLRIEPPTVRTKLVGAAANAPMDRDVLATFVDAFNAPGATAAALARQFGPDILDWAKATLEVTLDCQIAGAVAPGAALEVIFADPGSAGFYDAIYTAIGLGPTRCRPATVISISWGTSEAIWGGHLEVIDQALRAAAIRGITVVCSSGDFGSLNHPKSKRAQVNYPASSRFVLAVGGTSMTSPPLRQRSNEVVWNRRALGMRCASGGGVSGHWPRPGYQRRVEPGRARSWRNPHAGSRDAYRGIPDVAALADSVGAYRIWLGGRRTIGAGTSAATPLWAGLIARMRRATRGALQWVTPLLYRPELDGAFTDVIRGHNRISRHGSAYRAHHGWDCCTGHGSPRGDRLLAALASLYERPRAKRER